MATEGVQAGDGTFVRLVLEDILERNEDLAEELFGEDVDLSQGSPVKQIIDVTSKEHEYTWKLMEEVYYSAYYEDAYGEALDKILDIGHINRRPRRGATGIVTFKTNVPNSFDVKIRAGTRVATEPTDDRPSIPFKTTEVVTLEEGQNAVSNVPIAAVEPWETEIGEQWLGEETNVAAGTITRLETSIHGVDKVTNPYPTGQSSREDGYSFIPGRDRETDRDLRDRFEAQFGSEATATLDGIRSHVLDLPDVMNVDIEENVTMDTIDDIPPKSFRLTVLGDEPDDVIAQAITDKRSAGIQSAGSASGIAVTSDGVERTENWEWATQVDIYADVDVTHDSSFPSDGALQVENAVIREIGGTTAEENTFPGTGMGVDVIYDGIHAAAMGVQGVWRADVQLGTAADDLAADDVAIAEQETALTHYDDVNVFTTEQSIP